MQFEAFDEDEFALDDVLAQEIVDPSRAKRGSLTSYDDAEPTMKRSKSVSEDVYVEYSVDGSFKMRNGMKLKGQWTVDEDTKLIDLVTRYGTRRWSLIARALYGRVGKQCRERWNNHLAPDIKRGSWSAEEEDVLIRAHREVGNRWSDIARYLKGRTENSVKNHWNATKRRKDGSLTPFREYIMEYTSRRSNSALDASPDTTTDSNRMGPSPSHSTIKKEDAMNSNISTQDGFVTTSRLRLSQAVHGAHTASAKSILVSSMSVPELHEPIVIKLDGNVHDYVEIINSHEQLTQDRTHYRETVKDCEVASYASTIPLPSVLMTDTKLTLKGLVDAVRNHCPVVSLVLTVKSGASDVLKKFGGNCYMLSVSARKWEDAMQAVRLAVGFIKSSGEEKL